MYEDNIPKLKAVAEFIKSSLTRCVIKGSAGTGKTVLIKDILDNIPNSFVVAFTNKAANVLCKKGVEAKTIHSTFYAAVPTGEKKIVTRPVIDPVTHKPKRNKDGEIVTNDVEEPVVVYEFDAKNPERRGIVSDVYKSVCVIDEASMVPATMWEQFAKFPGKLIIVGDEKQLPPVEIELEEMKKAGHVPESLAAWEGYFQNAEPYLQLTVVHRQNEESSIHMMVDQILANDGDYPLPFVTKDVVCVDVTKNVNDPLNNPWFTDQIFFEGVDENASTVVISWTNAGCAYLNSRIRAYRFAEQYKNEPKKRNGVPRVGDKMYVEAKYDLPDGNVLNKGSSVSIVGVDDFNIMRDIEKGYVMVDMEDDEGTKIENIPLRLDFCGFKKSQHIKMPCLRACYGYALTCHKVQGSEYDYVTVIDDLYGNKVDKAKWMYTAATRAREALFVLKFPAFNRIAAGGK